MLLAAACAAAAPPPTRFATHAASSISFRRAEFWDRGSASLLEVANVLGRWESSEEWRVRTKFTVVEDAREQFIADLG